MNRGLAILGTAVLGPGVGHLMLAQNRAAAAWLVAAAAAYTGAALLPELMLWGLLLRVPCCLELWWTTRGLEARRRSLLVGIVSGVGIKIAVAVLLRLVWFEAYTISSGSMAPTLEIGDHILSLEAAYWFSEPEVGDVVVFDTPCHPGKIYVKRVVAAAGDRIEIRCGTLYLNDAELESVPGDRSPLERSRFDFPVRPMFAPCDGVSPPGEFLPSRGGPADCPRQGQFEVPPGHVFILGDNRENSQDSRIWGPIALDRIRGRATGVWWPWGRIGRIH